MSTVSLTVIMMDNTTLYHYRVQVMFPDKKTQMEDYQVREQDTRFGEAMATGKVVAFYDKLREKKKILDYRILY